MAIREEGRVIRVSRSEKIIVAILATIAIALTIGVVTHHLATKGFLIN